MKKIVVLVLAMGLLSTATFGAYATDEIKAQLTNGQTANWSDLIWKISTANNTDYLPWAGTKAIIAPDDNRRVEITIQQYGATVNSDAGTALGDNTVAGYNGTTPVLNTALKLNVKTGTFNMAGQTLWVDKLQNGTQSRTSFGTDGLGTQYFAKSVMNIGLDGKIQVTGTQAVANTGNIQIGYAASNDSYVKLTDNGILSGVKRDDLGNVLGAVNLDLCRNAASQFGQLELVGSDVTLEIGSLRLNQNATNTTVLRFVTDADGVAPIDVYGNGAGAVIFGVMSKLDFVLGAAPTESQVFTLLNLVYDGSTQNADFFNAAPASRRLLRNIDGVELQEKTNVSYYFEGTKYDFELSYKGGTGNDVVLTTIPEPATMGLLSLGGLILFRRRRA
jgi:hypothetical protein